MNEIVRALGVKWAKPKAEKPLIAEFRKAPNDSQPGEYRGLNGLKWAISNALSVVADDSVLDEIVEITRDKWDGRNREMVIDSLARMNDPRAVDELIELLDDEDIAAHAVFALNRHNTERCGVVLGAPT